MDGKQYLSKENVESIWELSLLQQEIFQQSENNENQINRMLRVEFTLNGRPLEVDKIQEAWKHTIRQTPLLRTVFRTARSRTVQVVLKEFPNPVEIVEENNIQGDEPEKHFNIKEEIAVHIKLIRETPDQVKFILSGHPIILDKKSLIFVLEDFLSIYDSLLKKKELMLQQRPIYKDYLDWLDRQYWLPGIAYWEKDLADFISPTSLIRYQPFAQEDIPRDSAPHLELTAVQSRELEQWCQQEGFSPGVLVQAAWALTLNLYSSEKDIYFGVELQGRTGDNPDFQNMIGPFTNILPLRVTIASRQSPRELIKQIEEKNRHLRQYPYITLQEIRTKLGMPREAILYESSVHVNPHPAAAPGCGDTPPPVNIDVRQEYPHSFALEVFIGNSWQMRLFSCKEPLPVELANQVLNITAVLMEAIRKNPGTRLSQLDYLPTRVREKLEEINHPEIHLPADCLQTFMHRLFEDQVQKRPTAIACTWGNHQVSYGELNQRANRLAHWMKEQGIGTGCLVAIFCERSIEMLTAILAIFKAGSAYIPLDTAHPDARIKTILLDSRVKAIFVRQPEAPRTLQLIREIPGTPQVFCLESLGEQEDIPNGAHLHRYPGDNLPISNRPQDPAYVIFTSGSTGTPKGAVVEHIGMVNHLWTKICLLQLSPASKVAQNASHCFDISVWQFLSALVVGGQTVIYSSEVGMTPWLFQQALSKDQVTILEMVPAVIEMMVEENPTAGNGNSNQTPLPQIRYMLSTGEALPTALCQKWREKYPHIPVVNAYGPTECSDDTHHCIVSAAQPLDRQYNEDPLGKIIPNFKGYILDEAMRILPPGCPGEICLTGIGVGKGYLNNPERTAEAFVKNPFPDGMGDRMYRTGDLGCFDHQGQLVFLGRIDHQVKVRGFRIELGEIEVQLRKHPAVKQCVVIIRKDSFQQNRILAYVVLNRQVLPAELQTFLEECLPHYMIPGHILELEKLPLNRSGKIDRQALPDPEQLIQDTDKLEPPANRIEKILVQIWEDVLEIAPISINHNFFELGGHSLRIIQVRSRINQMLEVDIPIIELFRTQTVRQLAKLIEEQLGDAEVLKTPPISKVPPAPYYPMSHAQQRLFFLHQVEPGNIAYNLPTALEIHASLDFEVLKRALQTVSHRQASLRTTFGSVDNNPVQFVADPRDYEVRVTLEDLSSRETDQRQQILKQRLKQEGMFKFDLTTGPLFFSNVFKLEAQRYVLFFNMHHIIGDLWSWEILFKELFALYQDFIEEKEISLPELTLQYSDYAVWQNRCIENDYFKVHEDYWDRQFAGELPILELPLDFPRPLIQKYNAGSVTKEFSHTNLKSLRRLFQQKNITSFIGWLTVFYTFLFRITNQADIIIGTPELGRNQLEVENLIGFFVNTLPIRIQPGEDPSFLQLLEQVKQVSLEAYEHAEYPLDLVINKLDLERDLSRYPLFSVLFQLDEAVGDENARPNQEASLNSLRAMNVFGVPINATNYDLEVVFSEAKNQEGLWCNFIFCKDLFKEETIRRWLDHFVILFEAIITSPDKKISSLPMLTEQEKHQLLNQWNHTPEEYPADQFTYVYRMVENQEEKTPEATALTYKNETITYRRFNQQANQLSHRLIEKGIFPGIPVGILMERDLNMVIGIMAILKAGAAYIPLDPAAPPGEIEYRVSDAGLSIVVTNPGQQEKIETRYTGVDYLCIPGSRAKSVPGKNPGIAPGFNNPAYIIYIQRFPGHPRGVQVSHRSLTNFAHSVKKHLDMGKDIMLAITNYIADISLLELILPLTANGQVVIAGEEDIHHSELLRDKIAMVSPTVMQAAPGIWKLLLQSEWQGSPYLKCIVASEVLPGELAQTLIKKCHSLYSIYGAAETAIGASFYQITPHTQYPNIVYPTAHTRMYILNPALLPVPPGITGELYIGGEGLADGYVNAPGLTAECFIPDPFDKSGKKRLYKTGDLARSLPDSNIQFLGPRDNQVKIRGTRIDVGEIETVLEKHNAVKQAVVITRKDAAGRGQLISYLVKNEQPVDTQKEKSRKTLKILGVALHSVDHFANNPIWKYSLPFLYLKSHMAQYPLYKEVLFETVDYYQDTSDEYIYDHMVNMRPDIILFSVYVWNFEKYKRLANKIKETNGAVKIILGGPEVGADETAILKENPAFDIIIRGEGEKTFYQLIDAILNHKNMADVKGITYKNDGQIRENEDQAPLNLDALPTIFDNRIYPWKNLQGSIVALETQRGCNFSCGFCQYKKTQHRIRYVPLEKVFKELDFIKDIEPDCLYLMDPTFNSDKDRAGEILKYIIRLNMKVKVIAEMIPECLDEELLELAARAGMVNLEVGVQSLNKNALRIMRRGQKLKDIETNIQIAFNKNINVIPQLIYGLPGDNLQEYCKSFDWLYMLDVDEIASYHLLVLRGSRFYKEKEKHQFIYDVHPPHKVISNSTFPKEDVILAGKMTAAALSTQYTLRKTIKNHCINKGIKPSYFFLKEVGLENFGEELVGSFPIYNEQHLTLQLECLKRIAGVLTADSPGTGNINQLVNDTEALLVSRYNTIKNMSKPGYMNRPPADSIEQNLWEFCKERLPDYMVPSLFIFLDHIPLSENGKIKRDALPVPANLEEKLPEVYEPPRTKIEKLLSKLWAEVLDTMNIGVNDNFFQLGGHSLRAMKLISQLRANHLQLTINDIFFHQTIKAQARYIADNMAKEKEDTTPIQNRYEAEQMFAKEFAAPGEFVTYHLEQKSYLVFYAADSLQHQYEKIIEFLQIHLTGQLFPHFIRPLSQKPTGSKKEIRLTHKEFSEILRLGTGVSQQMVENIIAGLEKDLTRFSKTIIQNETIRQYQLSPIQRLHISSKNRVVNNLVPFEQPLEPGLLSEAFAGIIKNHELLRSALEKKNGEFTWNEFLAPDRVTIPYIDLMGYDDSTKEKLMDIIVYQYLMKDFNPQYGILYRPVLFRKNLRTHWLLISSCHSIYDNVSGEIMKRDILNHLQQKEKNQNPHTLKPKPYSDYIKQISKGPQEINENHLVEIYNLKEYRDWCRKVETIINAKENDKLDTFNYTIRFQEIMNAEKIWNLSFIICNIYLKRYLEIGKIPMKLVFHGRHYQKNSFFNTVGEFIDFIPVLVEVDEENPLNMIAGVREKIDTSSKHNINFLTLMMDKELRNKWKRAANFLIPPDSKRKNDLGLVFNYNERKSEEEVVKRRLTPEEAERFKVSSFFCEVQYTARVASFNIWTSLGIDEPLLEELFTKELEAIMKKIG